MNGPLPDCNCPLWEELKARRSQTDNEVARLRRIVEGQIEALHHWRRLSDQDAGTIARYRAKLEAAGLRADQVPDGDGHMRTL